MIYLPDNLQLKAWKSLEGKETREKEFEMLPKGCPGMLQFTFSF